MNFNIIILGGHLTKDIQLSYLPSQTEVADFSMAVNKKWKTKDGEAKERVCFIDCRAFGKNAETLNKYVKKGSPLLISGELTFESWTSKDGAKHSKHRVTVESFQFIGSGESKTEPETTNEDGVPF